MLTAEEKEALLSRCEEYGGSERRPRARVCVCT